MNAPQLPGRIAAAALFLLLLSQTGAAQAEESALAAMRRLARSAPSISAVEDSLVRLCLVRVLPQRNLKSQDVYTVGTLLAQRDSTFFLGPLLRGWYYAEISTDRRGHSQARTELARALRLWPLRRYRPYHGSLDELCSSQLVAGLPVSEQLFAFNVTNQYLELRYQLSREHLELNEARAAWACVRSLLDENFAYDFYSLHQLAWLHYKYRYFEPGEDYPFLRSGTTANIREAIALSHRQIAKVRAYEQQKSGSLQYWNDNYLLSWHVSTAWNILSISYGVIWKNDSSIAYYERIPSGGQIANNGTYTYLADIDYRMAERQFDAVGRYGTQPAAVLSQPTAIESYKTMLIAKGTPEEAYAWLDDYTKKYESDRGWSMIWLGTVHYWNGRLDASARLLAQARAYPEVFGNISFNRTHYDMLANIQQSITYDAMAERLSFEPNLARGFFARLWNAVERFVLRLYYRFMALLYRHWAIDMYLQIEDRSEYLKVFYPENLADYFQTWTMLRQLDPAWHLDALRAARAQDRRPRAERFYRVFEAGLLERRGRSAEAARALEPDGRPFASTVDTAYEKLLLAMSENVRIAILDDEDPSRVPAAIVRMYACYPQAVQLWGHELPLRFRAGEVRRDGLGEAQRDSLDEALAVLEDFSFDFSPPDGLAAPELTIDARGGGGPLTCAWRVVLGGRVIAAGSVATTETRDGRSVALSPERIAAGIAYGVFRMPEYDR